MNWGAFLPPVVVQDPFPWNLSKKNMFMGVFLRKEKPRERARERAGAGKREGKGREGKGEKKKGKE